MKDFDFVSNAIFKSNKPFLVKKILTLTAIVGFLLYIIITKGLMEIIITLISMSVIILLAWLRARRPKLIKLFKHFYKNMYKKRIIDNLPITMTISESELAIKMHKAELMNKKPIDEIFKIDKEVIKEFWLCDETGLIIITLEKVPVELYNEEKNKTIIQSESIAFYVPKEIKNDIKSTLIENGYDLKIMEVEEQAEITKEKERRAAAKKSKVTANN